ncbi:MAG: hypothetical protein HKP12_10045 [Gammaproteobacteria bacterium]|nr:hypothetical protein [Gammaproteobacteria bacterium]
MVACFRAEVEVPAAADGIAEGGARAVGVVEAVETEVTVMEFRTFIPQSGVGQQLP